MKQLLLSLLSLILIGNHYALAQPIPKAQSPWRYAFKLSEESILKVLENGVGSPQISVLGQPVDSTQEESPKSLTSPGYYLWVRGVGGQETRELISVYRWHAYVVNNDRDLMIAVFDSAGKTISEAELTIGKTRLPFDPQSQTYRIKKSRREGLLQVTHQGYRDYYQLDARKGKITLLRIGKRLLYIPPISWVWWFPYRFVSDVVKSIQNYYPQGWVRWVSNRFDPEYYREKRERNYQGYLALDKPRHRPGDSVRIKAVLLDKKARPVEHLLKLYLVEGYRERKFIAELPPYRPGCYQFSWLPHDSLQLKLDQRYQLQLLDPKETKALSEYFRYEEYELSGLEAQFELTEKIQHRGQSLTLTARLFDENRLNVPGAKLKLAVMPGKVRSQVPERLFIPDVLWEHEQTLDPLGETIIQLSDSVFPSADLSYELIAEFFTVDGERIEKRESISFLNHTYWLSLEEKGDSLRGFWMGKNPPQTTATLISDLATGQYIEEQVPLPFQRPLDLKVDRYTLIEGVEQASLQPSSSQVQVASQWIADTLTIQMDNPLGLPIWYQLFQGKNNSLTGYTMGELDTVWVTSPRKDYFLSVSYLWRGEIVKKEYHLGFDAEKLEVEIQTPAKVYPGQTVELAVAVKDAEGRPIPNVDVLAYGLTSKFDPSLPTIPNLGPPVTQRKSFNTFQLDQSEGQGRAPLDYAHWQSQFRLDSLLAYQFLYPGDSLFTYAVPTSDSSTQLALYAIDSGRVQPSLWMYLDGKPFYLDLADNRFGYTQPVNPGWHQAKLYTYTHRITLDSFFIPKDHLFILSLDQDQFQGSQARTFKQVSDYEVRQLAAHLMPAERFPESSHAYLKQGPRIFPMSVPNTNPSWYEKVYLSESYLGPIQPGSYKVHLPGQFELQSDFEGGFSYEFSPQLVKMKSWEVDLKKIRSRLSLGNPKSWENHWPNFAWTESNQLLAHETLLDKGLYHSFKFHPHQATEQGFGQLVLNLEEVRVTPLSAHHPQIDIALLFKIGEADFLRLYPGYQFNLHQLPPGYYRYLGWEGQEQYFILDSLHIQANGRSFIRLDSLPWQITDSLSRALYFQSIQRWSDRTMSDSMKQQLKGLGYFISNQKTGRIRFGAQIVDSESREPLLGATLRVQNLRQETIGGTYSDVDGMVHLEIPPGATVEVSYIGYETKVIYPAEFINRQIELIPKIELEPFKGALEEVVIVGYGTQKVTGLTGAVSVVSNIPSIKIKGISSISGSQTDLIHRNSDSSPRQLYLVDGVVVEDLSFLAETQIASLDVLSSAGATAIYGSRASQGVIMVTTQNGANIPPDKVSEDFSEIPLLPIEQTPSKLRSNFDDLAYWQPALRTDQSGRAHFKVQFPDDITRWEQFGLAYDAKSRRMGATQRGTPSFQSFMAELSMPRFLVAGDRTTVFGKVRNLTSDTLPAELSFQSADSSYSTKSLELGPNALDTLAITAPKESDSLALMFRLDLPTQNYFDGEDRSIPVYPRGDRVSEGYFFLLAGDSNVTVSLPPGQVTLKAIASPLGLLQDELEHIGRYRFLCNEQAASKLKALLAKQRISEAMGEEFRQKREVRKLISHLLKGRNQDQLWGWWSQNVTSYWISNHVIEALLSAQALDYEVALNLSPLALHLTYQLTAPPFSASRQIELLESLHQMGHPLDFKTYLDSLDADISLSLSDHFRVQRLRQQLNLTYQLDTLRKYQQQSVYQELFWTSDGHRLRHGSIETTLLAYQLLKEDGNSPQDLLRIQAWLLRQRGPKGWANTYASIRVVETLLPDLLKEKAPPSPPKLFIQSDSYQDSLTRFPGEVSWENSSEITLQQRGKLPMYASLIQERYELVPVADSTYFSLKSWLNEEEAPDTSLRVGNPCSLNVEISSFRSAEYVLVEIPIPAGCSYLESDLSTNRYEVYREKRKDRVVICCRRLPIGKHLFSVSLQPRFPGTYVLNPARVEEMYFPTIFGRTAPKSLKIYSP